MWSNPPPVIDSLRTMVAACATFTSGTSHVHYPSATLSGELSTADPLPLAVLFHSSARRSKFAVGAAGLAQGSLSVVLYVSGDVGTVETYGQAILSELLAQDTGLALSDGEASPCSDPTPGQRAADAGSLSTEYRTITLTLSYGLRA